MKIRWLLGLALLTGVAWARPPVFSSLTLEEARRQAQAQHRWLLIDSTASWCQPCKVMDRLTWVDERVVRWLEARAIAIQLDVDQSKAEAESLQVEAMPTIIVVADGKELDRSTGLKSPEQLLAWLEGLQSGIHSLDLLRKAAEDGKVATRMELANDLVRRAQYQEALEHYLWFWDHPQEVREQGWWSVRHTGLSDMKTLLRKFGPTREALEERWKRLDASLAAEGLEDWVTLGRFLDEGERVLQRAQRLPPEKLATVNVRLYELMLERERWADAGAYLMDPMARAQRIVAAAASMQADLLQQPEEFRVRMLAYSQKSRQRQLAQLLRALRAAGRPEWEAVQEYVLQQDPSPEMKALLEEIK